jgi:nitrite reductase/ring-hydroxylating ferredoxin subunit
MAFLRICALSAAPPGAVAEGEVRGNRYAICNHAGEVHVFDASCPCTGGPLGQGVLRDGLLVCPWHGMRYDPRSGVCPYDPSLTLTRFAVEIRGDDILIEVDSAITTFPDSA